MGMFVCEIDRKHSISVCVCVCERLGDLLLLSAKWSRKALYQFIFVLVGTLAPPSGNRSALHHTIGLVKTKQKN